MEIVSIVLPCYNEAEHFNNSIKLIVSELKKLKYQFEIIFVEDKSTDNTKNLIKKFLIGQNRDKFRAIFHERNQGRGKAVLDGINSSKGKYVGFIDIDCEVSPKYIGEFINKLKNGYDIIYGHRTYEISISGLIRTITSKTYKKLVNILINTTITDTETGYKFFNRKKIIPILKLTKSKGWFWDTEIMIRSEKDGLKIASVPVLFNRRKDKTSTVNLLKDSTLYLLKLLQFRKTINK